MIFAGTCQHRHRCFCSGVMGSHELAWAAADMEWLVKVNHVEHVPLLVKRSHLGEDRKIARGAGPVGVVRRDLSVCTFVVVHRQRDLFQVVAALHATSGLACGLDRGKQQSNQDADDGDHNQQFHQGEAASR